MNKLHHAAMCSPEQIPALLSAGFGIDVSDPDGYTPLMISSLNGYARAVKIMLSKGANIEKTEKQGNGALHHAAGEGHVAVTKMLLEAGADLEAKNCAGCTPLHVASFDGRWGTIRVLIAAGACINSRMWNGQTPLYVAAQNGHLHAVKELLRAKADALLFMTNQDGDTFTPLEMAAQYGHSSVVREMIQQVGIKGCDRETGGVDALFAAAKASQLEVMATLLDAGVVDSGFALTNAGQEGSVGAIKFLLQRPSDETAGGASYVDNKHNPRDYTPLLLSIAHCQPCTRKIVRLLIDAGADTSAAVCVTNVPGGLPWFNDTPLAYTLYCLHEKKIGGEVATEEQLQSLESVRRLLMRVDAVHAVSWLWRNDDPAGIHRTPDSTHKAQTATSFGSPLTKVLPLMRRRAARRGMSLSALFR